jgi:hypothetical protein
MQANRADSKETVVGAKGAWQDSLLIARQTTEERLIQARQPGVTKPDNSSLFHRVRTTARLNADSGRSGSLFAIAHDEPSVWRPS